MRRRRRLSGRPAGEPGDALDDEDHDGAPHQAEDQGEERVDQPADESAAADLDAEPTLQFMVEPAEGQEIDPPLDIDLPANWAAHNGTLLIQDIDAHLRLIPYTAYRGPVSGGEGFIVLLWGFVQATPGNPADMTFGQPDIHLDGLLPSERSL